MDISTTTVLWLAGILTGALALQFGRRVFVNRVFNRLGREDQGRVGALREITQSALRWAIWLTAIIVALGTLGVDVGALIALFGIAGLAISFGAQSFIKDLISYVVFVFADNFRIGEEVLMDGKRGRIQSSRWAAWYWPVDQMTRRRIWSMCRTAKSPPWRTTVAHSMKPD